MLRLIKSSSRLIIGIFIGVILMGGVSYAVDNLSSESVSYTRDGQTKTVKQALDELIGKAVKVDDLEEKVAYYKNMGVDYLASVAKVGDYVAYDAGDWKSTVAIPNEQGKFGGYTEGHSKGESVICGLVSSWGSTSLKGWRVLKVENKQVYLVHAGQPECYYHGYNSTNGYSAASVKLLNDQATKEYKNEFAESAHALDYNEALEITNDIKVTSNDLRNTGAYYWLADAGDSARLYLVGNAGNINGSSSDLSYGFRPVVVLKEGILTTGKGIDEFKQEAWTLVAPQ